MAMSVTCEVVIPNCAPTTVTLTNVPPDTVWRATAHQVTRTCPVSGDIHTMELDVIYQPNYVDWHLDLVLINFAGPAPALVTTGPQNFPALTSSTIGAETQARTGVITVENFADMGRLRNGAFTVIVTGMPVSYLRIIQTKIAFGYSLVANGIVVVVHEDAGGGVAGAVYGSVITDANGRCSLRYFAPLRDFVLRVHYDGEVFDVPLAAGAEDVAVTTAPPVDKTASVLRLLATSGSGPGANPG